jgi:hypothetical protein
MKLVELGVRCCVAYEFKGEAPSTGKAQVIPVEVKLFSHRLLADRRTYSNSWGAADQLQDCE